MDDSGGFSDGLLGDVWLSSARKQSLLPGSPWYKVQDELLPKLAESIVKKFTEPKEKIIIFDLPGKHFLGEFLPCNWLESLSSEERDKLTLKNKENESVILEIKQWLYKEISDIAVRYGSSTKCHENNRSEIFNDFYGFCFDILHTNMEQKLAMVEQDLIDRRNTRGHRGKANSKHPWGHQTECLGTSLSVLVRGNPEKIKNVCKEMIGRQLPYTFRETLWEYQLIHCVRFHEVQDETSVPVFKLTDDLLENKLKDFKYKFQCGLGRDDETSKPFESGISGIIQHNVQDSYKNVYGLQENETKRLINMACIVLDLVYIANKIYEPYLPLLLMPLLLVFYKHGRMLSKDEIAVKLAVNLQQLIQQCMPSLPETFSIAEQVIKRLKQEDQELYEHLISSTRNNISLANPVKEFLIHYIQSYEELSDDALDLLTHPVVFIRKWLAEGFVGALDMRATLFIWDQCFMTGWDTNILEITCLALLELLKPQLLQATDYRQVKEVMLLQPAFLYTLHIQKAVMHLYNGRNLKEILDLIKEQEIPDSYSDSESQSSVIMGEEQRFSPQPGPSNMGTDGQQTMPVPVRVTTPSLAPYWVEYDKTHGMSQIISPKEPFSIYIDAVRFIPDNATVVKVTGRIFHPDWTRLENFDDIQAFAMLDSPGRCPELNFHFSVKPGGGGSSVQPCPDGVLVLRIYTVDFTAEKKDLVVIGSCAFQLYETIEDHVRLCIGGHQLRVFNSLPSTDKPLSEKMFSKLVKVPSASILIRILPHSENVVQPPEYSSGYYQSESCQPTESEERIYQHYLKKETLFPALVRDAVVELMDAENVDSTQNRRDDNQLLSWYKTRLGKHQLQGHPALDLDLLHAISYEQDQGLAVQVLGAYGLPNALVTHAFVYLVAGRSTEVQDVTEEGYGGEEKFITKSLNMSSYPKSPRWTDKPTIFHPHFNKKSFIILQLFTLDVVYTPRQDRAGPGMLEGKKGKDPVLISQGWAVLPLFSKSCVNGGIHHLPFIQGSRPPVSFIDIGTSYSAEIALTEGIQQKILQPQGTSSIKVRLYDDHYTEKECLPLPENTSQLALVGSVDKYTKTASSVTGKPLSELVLRTLSKDGKKQGIAGLEYQREKGFFEDSVNMTFYNLMENIALRLGLGPLEWP